MLTERTKKIKTSLLHEFYKKAKETKGAISLAVGELDFSAPFRVRQRAKRIFEEGLHIRYTPAGGLKKLRELAAQDFKESGIDWATPENVIIGPGAKPLLAGSFWAICEEGYEVIIPSPFYPPYLNLTLSFGGKPVLLDTKKDGFLLKGKRLEEMISEKTRAIVFNSPNNPTGAIWNPRELSTLPENIIFIADEAYFRFVYEGKFESLGRFKFAKERTIVIRSFSKTFAMSGFRLGYLLAPNEIAEKIESYLDMAVGCPNYVSQEAGIWALEREKAFPFLLHKVLSLRRDYLICWLQERKISFAPPMGAFYIFADFSRFGSSLEVAEKLLNEAKVVVTPGTAFGNYEGYLRLSYSNVELEKLREALDRIDKVLFKKR